MFETKPDSFRRNLSKKRSFRAAVGGDDRGWTLLHVGARKGDLNEVCDFLDFSWYFRLDFCCFAV